MIILLTKTMYTKILGQPQIRAKGQYNRTEGFTYSFTFNLKRKSGEWTTNWGLIEKIAIDCLFQSVGGIGTGDERKLNVKDMELSVDISSGNYTVRFSSDKDLPEDAYAFELLWIIYDAEGRIPLQDYPYDYAKRTGKIAIEVVPVPLDEIERC